MFVKNNGRYWVNGSIGKVDSLEHDKVFAIKDGNQYKVEKQDGNQFGTKI